MIAKLTSVKPLDSYAIYVRFSDGTQGTVDLSHLAHKGVFRQWDTNNLFSAVHIDNFGAIAWNEDIDICPDSVWLQLKGISFEEWQHQNQKTYAAN